MTCNSCSSEVSTKAKFCPNCGSELGKKTTPAKETSVSSQDELMRKLSLPGFEYGKLVIGFVSLVVVLILVIIVGSSTGQNGASQTTPTPTEVEKVQPADPGPTETIGQQNARGKAEDYLRFSAFSKVGLVKQLEFEGFTTEDAKYAVNKVNVDWNEQAAKKAKQYMDFSSFSANGLIAQLIFEGFTELEAAYGAYSVGFRP